MRGGPSPGIHVNADVRPTSAYLVGRMTGTADRGERTLFAYDERGRGVWQARQMALIADDSYSATTLTGAARHRHQRSGDHRQPGLRLNQRTHLCDHQHVRLRRPANGVSLPLAPDFSTSMDDPPSVTATTGYNWLRLPVNAIGKYRGHPAYNHLDDGTCARPCSLLTYFGDDKALAASPAIEAGPTP